MNLLSFLIASLLTPGAAAFVGIGARTPSRSSAKPLHLMDGHVADLVSTSSATVASQFNNMLLATIDADIANVPENEFAPIFAGGILVMFGGVMSALIVGLILETNNSYANVIADSYVQGAEDEEFWKGLSDEEKKKTQDLLQKLKESKGGAAPSAAAPSVAVPDTLASATETTAKTAPEEESAAPADARAFSENAKDPGMFSDY